MSKKSQIVNCRLQFFLLAAVFLASLPAAALAAEETKTREIYVPFSDLHVLLDNQPKRVLIGRDEYNDLVKKAARTPEAGAPRPALISAADYSITVDRNRAEIAGELTVDVLEDGLHALPLDVGGVGLRTALLDGRAAPIGLGPDGRPVLFVEGTGRRRLELEMTAPLEATAARQVLNYRLPRPAAATLRLVVPGDVEIKGGAAVISRKVEGDGKSTRFELLPQPGDVALLMTLNSRLHRQERAVAARSVVIDEIAQSHETLRASVTMSVLHRAVDRFRFVVPDGFEITDVASPLLARWEVVPEEGRRVLEARLREQTAETVTLGITAVRAPAKLDGWTAPRLVPLDVIGSVTVLGLLVDGRLKAEAIAGEGLIPIDTAVLGSTDGAGTKQIIAAWYAPQGDYALSARFVRPKAEMDAAASLVLTVADKGLELQGGLSLLPRVDKRFAFEFVLPAGWQATGVTTADGKPLPFEIYPNSPLPLGEGQGVRAEVESNKSPNLQISKSPNPANHSPHPNPLPKGEGTDRKNPLPKGEGTGVPARVRVAVSAGMKADEPFRAIFRAVRVPKDWTAEWRETRIEFPRVAVPGATNFEGAIAVEPRDDMTVRPEKIEHLTPLSAEEENTFGLTGVPATLGYRIERARFAVTLLVERAEPRMTAQTFSFFRVDRDALHCRYEINYAVEQSRARQLVFSLPADTPDAVSIVGLDGVRVKDPSDKVSGGRRRWTVLLAEPARGRLRLAVDFQQRLPRAEPKGYRLPVVEAGGVVYQSGFVAVEGCAELEVAVNAAADSLRPVDVGELAEADYQPGRRLLGAYGFVGDPPAVSIDVERRPGYGIPSAIVEQCELDTFLSPDGRSRTRAVFSLRSKEPFLQIVLPTEAKLWSAELDGVPLKPQCDDRGVLVDLSAGKGESLKRLQITYADDRPQPVALLGEVRVPAPKLFLRAGTAGSTGVSPVETGGTSVSPVEDHATSPPPRKIPQAAPLPSVEVPLVDFLWRLHLPSGYEVVRAGGTLSTGEVARPRPAAFRLAKSLYAWSGGFVGPGWMPLPSGGCSYSPVRYSSSPPMPLAKNSRGLTAPGVAALDDSPELVFVGRITGMKDCRWTDPQTEGYMGSSVVLGRKYAIASGLLEVAYKEGAKVILEGPVNFEVESPAGGYLSLGKVTVRTDEQQPTEGRQTLYSVRTPTATITAEPGSEFGVEVAADGATRTHVFRGSVYQRDTDAKPPAFAAAMEQGHARRLGPGESAEVGRDGDKGLAFGSESAPPAFARRMERKPKTFEQSDEIVGGRVVPRESRGAEKYAPVDLAKKSETEKRIEEALESPTQIEFIETPLKEVVDYLKDFHHIEIQFDNRALSDVGYDADTPITKSMKGISLKSALRQMLKEEGLTYMIKDDVLLISTPECAETRLTTVVYPVSDLVMDYRTKSGEKWSDFDSLIDLIAATARPTTWDEVGGPGSIAPLSKGSAKALVVNQTEDVHEEIKDLLGLLRRLPEEPGAREEIQQREKPERQKDRGVPGGMGGMAGAFGGPPPVSPAAEMPIKKPDEKKITVGLNSPEAFSADADINAKDAEERDKLIARRKAAIAALGKIDGVEKADVPYYETPPVEYPDAKDWQDLTARRKEKFAARDLAGVRSLKIDLLQSPDGTGRVVAFRSLGVDPLLAVTLADDSRFARLRLGLALAVLLAGAAMTFRSARAKTHFVLVLMLLTTLLALSGGVELAKTCNAMFLAAAWLVPYYLAAGFLRWVCRACCPSCRAARPAVAALLLAALAGVPFAQAAEKKNRQTDDETIVVRVIKPPAPIDLPADAIILPYDPEWKNGVKDADKLLVPYEKYVELWNRAYPDKKIETKAPPAPYALAGASYKTLLVDGDSLLLAGQMEIDVFTDGFVQVPLGLGGGVLTRAELDGKPARVSVVEKPQPPTIQPHRNAPHKKAVRKSKNNDPFADEDESQGAQRDAIPSEQSPFKIVEQSEPSPFTEFPDRSVVVLHVSGKGRHKLELAVRLKLERQGGWRVAEGVLPAAPATALAVVVPAAKTELRLGEVADCRQYETERPDQTINTTLGRHGAIALRWRPEVAAGQIDRTLTAASDAVFDVREDGLRMTWSLALEFRRSERDRFSVKLPEGYLLEKVEGVNVRGWEVRSAAGGRTVEVSLLQPAKDREQFALRLWRAERIAGKPAAIDVPAVAVPEAALQSGRLTVRRSPLIELRTLDRSGVMRIDLPDAKNRPAGNLEGAAGPLGIRPFEAYGFATVPFTLRVEAAEVKAQVSANVDSILKLAEHRRSLESRIRFDIRGRRAYRLRVLLPEDFKLDRVDAPGAYQFAVTRQDRRPLLTVYLASGQEGEVPLVVSGTLGREGELSELPLPRIEVPDADRQQGEMAVQADPAYDVEAFDLSGCESVLLGRLSGWLNPGQREAARLAIHCAGADYSGKLRLKPRAADVVCDTITNVRVTDRTLEETILLNFTVTRAGVRRLEFLLPEWMADSRFSVPLLQRKSVAAAGAKHPGMVRVRLDLQEDAMGEIRVVVENDRLLAPGEHQAPIPAIVSPEKGDSPHLPERAGGSFAQKGTVPFFRTNRRYAVVENAGRGEVVVDRDELRGMDPLGRHGKDWAVLKDFLGEKITMAYLVSSDAERPRLVFRVESRDAVKIVQAAIGLSETTMVVDANGAYRAEVVLHVNNQTEQYLDVQLPAGAALWTAQVAGEPVKPTLVPVESGATAGSPTGATAGSSSSAENTVGQANRGTPTVRIPLIKTAPGDLDFPVVLRYGGRMSPLRKIGVAEFPMIRCLNVAPQLSHATLHLPERFGWFDFGGTMRRTDFGGIQSGVLQYQYKQLGQVNQALQSGDKWTKARATASVEKQLGLVDRFRAYSEGDNISSLSDAESTGKRLLKEAKEEAERQQSAPAQSQAEDNRRRLNDAYRTQTVNPSKNVVGDLGANWAPPPADEKAQTAAGRKTQSLTMMVTPQIIIQKEEEKKLDVQTPQADSSKPGAWSLGATAVRGFNNPRREDTTRQLPGDDGRQAQPSADAESLNRYQQRLAKQAQTGGAFGFHNAGQQVMEERRETTAPFTEPARPSDAPVTVQLTPFSLVTVPGPSEPSGTVPPSQPPAAGLASLDFELPVLVDGSARGQVYCFTAPRGGQRITARYVADDLTRRLLELAIVGAAALAVWIAASVARRGGFAWLARPAGSWLLVGLGVLSIVAGAMPAAGLAAVVVGFGLKVRRLTAGEVT